MAKTKKTTYTAPITTSIPQNGNRKFAPRADIVLLVSVTGSNPNGDPDDEGRPRVDLDGKGVISHVSIKRKFRDTALAYADSEIGFFDGEENRNKIFVEHHTIRSQQVATVLDLNSHPSIKTVLNAKESENDSDNKKSGCVSREDRAYAAGKLCETFLDARVFGQSIGTIGAISGPVQIENAVSVNVIDIEDRTISATQVANTAQQKQKGDHTFGRMSSVHFGLYPIYIHVSGIRAKQTGMTREDFERMLDILREMYEQTNSSVRNVQFEQMFVFEHENLRGSMMSKDLHKLIDFKFKKDVPSSMDDIEVTVDKDMLDAYPGIKFYTK